MSRQLRNSSRTSVPAIKANSQFGCSALRSLTVSMAYDGPSRSISTFETSKPAFSEVASLHISKALHRGRHRRLSERRPRIRHEQHFRQAERVCDVVRDRQMAQVNRIEGASEYADHHRRALASLRITLTSPMRAGKQRRPLRRCSLGFTETIS